MRYFKKNGSYIATILPPVNFDGLEEITQEEYIQSLEKLETLEPKPSEEEIRKQKEAELHRLLRELYPEEEE